MSAKKTRQKAVKPVTPSPLEAQLIAGIQWHHRDDGELPPFNQWVMVMWWAPSQEHTEWEVGTRREAPGGGWTWNMPKKAAENFEYWAHVPSWPASRKPKPPPRKLRSWGLDD